MTVGEVDANGFDFWNVVDASMGFSSDPYWFCDDDCDGFESLAAG